MIECLYSTEVNVSFVVQVNLTENKNWIKNERNDFWQVKLNIENMSISY